ncbi:cobalamin biosynthesis protein [Agrobacterium larrymoorei]|uniref:cobalamin biosynthesis protein n=1 Tax=Agrobacterium larrymoorei TaxID=160699 RepID=UPI00307EDFA3
MIVAGIGCRRGVGAEAVIAALKQASETHGLSFEFIATAPIKADESGLLEAATKLNMAFVVVAQADFDAAGRRTSTCSTVSLAHAASPSVSEASALAALGEGSKLIAPRMVIGDITVAFATSGDTK